MTKNKKDRTMAEVSAGYEKFAKGKELNKGSKKQFDKAITKAAKPRGSK